MTELILKGTLAVVVFGFVVAMALVNAVVWFLGTWAGHAKWERERGIGKEKGKEKR